MKDMKKDYIRLLDDLCYLYKDYVSKHEESRIEVHINNSMIKMYLIDRLGVADHFGLCFTPRERQSYIYISLQLMRFLFGNRIIYNKDIFFFDDMERPSLKMVVDDASVMEQLLFGLSIYRDIDFEKRIDKGRKVRRRVNHNRTARLLQERIVLSKRLLENRDR